MADETTKESKWHSRVQSTLLTMIAGVSVWALQTLFVVNAKVSEMKPRVDNIEIALSGTYTRKEAEKDQAATGARISADENRLDGIEARVRHLEVRAVRP
jgi:hypothetical protein